MNLPLVVLDTNVLVAAIRSRLGASYAILSALTDVSPRFSPVVSVPLVLEYEAALLEHVGDVSMDEGDVGDLLDYICSVARHQDIFYLWRPMLSDPGDDHVLEVAVASGAEMLVTHNVRDFAGSESLGVRVVTPGIFLRTIGIGK